MFFCLGCVSLSEYLHSFLHLFNTNTLEYETCTHIYIFIYTLKTRFHFRKPLVGPAVVGLPAGQMASMCVFFGGGIGISH